MIKDKQLFIYNYIRHSDEFDLCKLEMRAFFGFDSPSNVLISPVKIDPSRSPFMKERLEVLYEAETLEQLILHMAQLNVGPNTFKVISLNDMDIDSTKKIGHDKRQKVERKIGLAINGEPDLVEPQRVFGVMVLDDKWYFGDYTESEPIWFRHQKKPHSYSTALSTRVARAVANIAVPEPEGVKVIDPCCGIGNVLVEALSMGMNIVGRDINPLIIEPTLENIRYFGLEGQVIAGPIADIIDHFDVAIIDMPYNIFSKATPEQQRDILLQARRIANRVIVVTIDTIDTIVEEVGFTIVDRGVAKKGLFVRQVLVCE